MLQDYISKSKGAGFWYHDKGGCQYECYGSAGLLGVVVIEFLTVNISYRVKCNKHKSRCQKLVGSTGKTLEQMLDLLGKWLFAGSTLNEADQFFRVDMFRIVSHLLLISSFAFSHDLRKSCDTRTDMTHGLFCLHTSQSESVLSMMFASYGSSDTTVLFDHSSSDFSIACTMPPKSAQPCNSSV